MECVWLKRSKNSLSNYHHILCSHTSVLSFFFFLVVICSQSILHLFFSMFIILFLLLKCPRYRTDYHSQFTYMCVCVSYLFSPITNTHIGDKKKEKRSSISFFSFVMQPQATIFLCLSWPLL
jgi:dolichol kinase